ncbi:hypothetical protein EAG_14410 [Camponotus floridanus]|uniref:Uncharacterized protein n=1 Tax=Camponotus floridanus TaxID=104421 RepID=E2ABQ0_CAMFO|nr:hypothetical protein EAG_14410 [Camponotus floridanus]
MPHIRTGCAVVDATVGASLYRHDNEFPGVYDHATSSNPPLPFQSSRVVHPYACVAVRHIGTLYPHFDFAPCSGIENVETGEPHLRYNVSSTYR